MKEKKYFIFLTLLISITIINLSIMNGDNIHAIQEEMETQYVLNYNDFSNWEWTDLEIISTESDDLSQGAFVAADSSDRIHVVWQDNSDLGGPDEDIYYKFWRPGGWYSTIVVSTESTGFSNMPELAFDKTGNVHFVWTDTTDISGAGTDYDIFYKFWNITSDIWSSAMLISDVSNAHSYRPTIVIDEFDTIHIAWYDYEPYLSSGPDPDIYYRNYDSGTWSTIQLISQESIGTSSALAMDADNHGNVYITWHDNTAYNSSGTDNDIVFRYWNKAKSSWSPINVISTESDYDSTYPTLKVDSVDNVHVAWRDISDYLWAGPEYDIFYKSFKQGTGWTNSEIVSAETIDGAHAPHLAVNDQGQVFIAWVDYTPYGTAGIDTDIFFKVRDPVLEGWTDFRILSFDSTSDSYTPRLDIDSIGNVHVVWFDGTDLLNSGTDYDIFYHAFGALPSSPDLAYITPNPTSSSSIELKWNNVLGAEMYHIYRASEYIWSTEDLVPVGSIFTSPYTDHLEAEGVYYYVVIAENRFGNGSHSICQPVKYDLSSLSEILTPIGIFIGFSIVMFAILVVKRKNK
ncbi:MAG: hypothetical protein ACXABK_02040 [Candidatus Heimdallarchaeaceae archaeon]|jgi:hypothetical protein